MHVGSVFLFHSGVDKEALTLSGETRLEQKEQSCSQLSWASYLGWSQGAGGKKRK